MRKKNLQIVHSLFIICLYLLMSNKQKQEIMTTVTETKNFKDVIVETVIFRGIIETTISFNSIVVWSTNKVQNIERQHKIAISVAESYTLTVGIENNCIDPFFRLK